MPGKKSQSLIMLGCESDPMGVLPLDPTGAEPEPPPERVLGGMASVVGSRKHIKMMRMDLLTVRDE